MKGSRLFEEINASKSSLTFDGCFCSWVTRKIFACRTNSFVQSFLRSFLNNAAGGGWVCQVLLCTRERKFGRFSRILLEEPSCFQSNSELNLHLASAKISTTRIPTKITEKRKQLGRIECIFVFSSQYLYFCTPILLIFVGQKMSFTGLKNTINIFCMGRCYENILHGPYQKIF